MFSHKIIVNAMKTFLTALFCAIALCAGAVTVDKSTYVYAVRGQSDTLRMDRYAAAGGEALRPAVIFAFGGSFTHGKRDDVRYLDYFNFLARNGYVVLSVDYRTAMASYRGEGGVPGFAAALGNAVQTAVEDYISATAFALAAHEQLGIDPSRIVASGSSAGAITALQAEYVLASDSTILGGFNYAGAVTFAGAVCTQGAPQWNASRTCPMMLFHGDVDTTVPFGALEAGGMGLYGSKAISDALAEAKVSHELYVINNADHSVAISPMQDNLYDILAFLREYVGTGLRRQTVVHQSLPGAPADYNTTFTLADYLRSNLGR